MRAATRPHLLINATSNESTRSWGVTINVDFVSQADRHFMNFVTLITSSCAAKFYATRNTFSALPTSSMNPRLPHSHTTSGVDGTDSCFRNTLDILWTLILSHACYIRTFIDPILCTHSHTLVLLYCISSLRSVRLLIKRIRYVSSMGFMGYSIPSGVLSPPHGVTEVN